MPCETSRAALAQLAEALDDHDGPPVGGGGPTPEQRAQNGASLLGQVVDVFVGARRLAGWALWLQLLVVAQLVGRWQSNPPVADGAVPDLAGIDGPGAPAAGALVRRLWRLVDDIDIWGPVDTRDLAEEFVAAEISAAAGLSHYAAAQVVDAARTLFLTERLPRTQQLLRAGLLDWTKLRTILTATQTLDDQLCPLVEAHVIPEGDLLVADPLDALADPARPGRDLPAVARMTNPALQAALAAAIAALDAEAAARRAKVARRDRRVSATPLADSMGRIELTTGHEEVAAVLAGLDHAVAAAKHAGDDRSADQIRADHAVHLLTGGAHGRDASPAGHDTAEGSGRHGRRGLQVRLTMPLSTWLGLSEDPALLDGYGPLPAAIARQIAADAARDHPATTTWRCLPVDDRHGTVLGVGDIIPTPRYAPTTRQRTFVRAAEPFCVFPGCRARAHRCEIDHRRPYDHDDPTAGGPTCTCNLQNLCTRHHRLKTAGLVTPRAVDTPGARDGDLPVVTGDLAGDEPPGTVEWTTWTGRRYLHRPPRATPEPADPDVLAARPKAGAARDSSTAERSCDADPSTCADGDGRDASTGATTATATTAISDAAADTDPGPDAALPHWERARRRILDREAVSAARRRQRGARDLSDWQREGGPQPPPF
ncbi:MAG TPA: DUF222 domain-containing protein [Kineosporiaceae bacterium]|nr:DUF222 domain-containing protein [Kineosporiaceae bacterium]